MALLDIFKKKEKKEEKKPVKKKVGKKSEKRVIREKKTQEFRKKKVEKKEINEAYKILKRPLITEKATDLGMLGKYVFEVDVDANRIQIKEAVQNLYGVQVLKVNIINVSGKYRRLGKTEGRTRARKKAIVTLAPGEKIELFEGV